MSNMEVSERIIVALNVPTFDEACQLMDQLGLNFSAKDVKDDIGIFLLQKNTKFIKMF